MRHVAALDNRCDIVIVAVQAEAIQTDEFKRATVYFQHALRTGLLVQPVNVLRDDRVQAACAFQVGQRAMRGIWFGMTLGLHQGATPFVVGARIADKALDGCDFARIGFRPEAGAGAAKIGDTGSGRNARAGQRNRMARMAQQVSRLRNLSRLQSRHASYSTCVP